MVTLLRLPFANVRATLTLTASAILASTGLASAQVNSGPPALDPTDLSSWNSIRSTQVSHDGRWVALTIAPNEGDAEVVVRQTNGSNEHRFPVGSPPARAGFGGSSNEPVRLSGDGAWLAMTTYPTVQEAEAANKKKERLNNGVTLVALSTGEYQTFEGVSRYAFTGESPRFLVMQRTRPEDAPKGGGSTVLIVDLETQRVSTMGNVGEFAVNDRGDWLAWTSQASDQLGNGVSVQNLTSGVVTTLDSERAGYTKLAWADEGPIHDRSTALSVLRETPDSAAADTAYVVLGFTGFGNNVVTTLVDPAQLDRFPPDMRISPAREAEWSDDRSMLLYGIVDRRETPMTDDERPDVKPVAGVPGAMQTPPPDLSDEDDLPSLVLWHGRDPRLQSRQQVQENADRSFSFLAAHHLSDGRFVRLADEDVRTVDVGAGQDYAVGYDNRTYQLRDAIDGGNRRDVYAIDTDTGERRLILEAQRWPVLYSPDGEKLLYYRDGHYHMYRFADASHTNLTADAPVRFVDVEDDHNVVDPPIRPIGWSSDSKSVLLSDDWDVWRVSVDGGEARNLTRTGRTEGVRHRSVVTYDRRQDGINLSQPVYVQAYGERSKKSGLVRLTSNGSRAERILWDDAYHTIYRARDRDTFVYTRETFQEFPDVWAADGAFDNPVRLTDANSRQNTVAWSAGGRLVDYVSDKGDSLQAALFLPADYREGEDYPTVVYIYEKLSQNLHRFVLPNETRAFNPSVYTSRGYAVLMPDIVYQVNDPGMSAVWSVVPAVQAAIETGVVDAERVGLHGHSWGGYQTAFLVTQTDIFSSAIAGAALTDMVSMYNSVYWNSGNANQGIFESSQGRFEGSPLDHYDAYIRNSPVFHAANVATPLVLLHNEKDGAVDFNQGITYFNALREAEKEVVLLQYVGENHGLREPKNQKDYAVRMREFFDHYLMGAPAPDWWTDGVPRLEMEEHLRRRAKKKVVS